MAKQSRALAKLEGVQAELEGIQAELRLVQAKVASESSRLSRLALQQESLRTKGSSLADRGFEELRESEEIGAPTPSENASGGSVAFPDSPAFADFLAGQGFSEETLLADDYNFPGSSPAPMYFLRVHSFSI